MAKYAAFGTQFKVGANTVTQVRSISGPSVGADTIDVSTHDSAAAWREFVAGLLDGGEVTLELVYDPDATHQTTLRTNLVARTANAYSITFTDATPAVASFSAIVTSYEPNAPHDGELSLTVTLKITGAVSWA